MSEAEILFEKRGRIGLVTLNRPRALNALNEAMCTAHRKQLAEWEKDGSVQAVVVRGAGDKAFCAGGDVVSLYQSGRKWKEGDKSSLAWRDFFREEYRMNAAVQEFGKPYISLLDGITMGGGVGISIHGLHRIATENTVFAMPETGLGLIPDVGGGWFLPRLPGESGTYIALTGERLKAAETCALGLTGAMVPADKLEDLIAALAGDASDPGKTIAAFSASPGESRLQTRLEGIARIFSQDTVEEIMLALERDGSEWALTWHGRLLKKSPTSMKVTLRQLREGARLDNFRENMKMEFRIVNRILAGHDFYEGVRALLLDKDNAPEWKPASLDAVSDAAVAEHFAPLGGGELTFEQA